MTKKVKDIYITDTTEDEKYGDTQVLLTNDEEKKEDFEKSGNQEERYYKCDEKDIKVEVEEKVGNQNKEYYNE